MPIDYWQGSSRAEDIKSLAYSLGVNLEVPKDEDVIQAYPDDRVTPKLEAAIKADRGLLMRALLQDQACDYLNRIWVDGADLNVLAEPTERLVEFWDPRTPLAEYRQAIRDYVQAGHRECARLKRGRQNSSAAKREAS